MIFPMVSLMGLMLSAQANTAQQSTVAGQVRLADGWPVAGAQVTLFDLANLHRGAVARAMTDEAGYFALSLSSLGGSALPQGFALGANYPNPFNPSTVIPYQLPTATHVRLDVFNVLGQHVATLVDAEQQAGFHAAKWDATDAAGQAMAAGVYFYRLTVSGGQQTERMVLIDGQAGIAAAAPSIAATNVPVDATEREYGLVVSGEGLTTYADAAFGVQVGMAAVELVVDAAPLTTDQVLAGEILGDVNNDGQVVVEDAMLVVMHSANPSVAMPNNGSILLGDVNGDGAVNETDVLVIMRYIANPLDGALPAGIGQRIASGKLAAGDTGVLNLTSPSWSPDGRHIAFSSNRDGNFEIYVMDSDGSNPRRLTDHGASDVFPSWSADGQYIAFSSNRDGNFEIYVMDSDGSNPRRLTDHGASDVSPSWSADGRHIAFSSNRDGNRDGNFEIYVMDSDGSNPRRLTDDEADDESPSWSADGRHIAFSSNRDGNRDGNFEIYVMDSDGSNSRRLTDDKDRDVSPSWSPDGRHIVFSSFRDGNFEIYVMDSDGSNPRRLTDDNAWNESPSWSPDGRHIAFSSNDEIDVMEVLAEPNAALDAPGFTEPETIDREPEFADTVANQTVTEGEVLPSLVLPAGSGGDGELTYSLSLDGSGLTFNAATRTLSGTPTAAGDYALIYRVEDSDGDADELTFTVTVTEPEIVDREPMFTDTVADQRVVAGEVLPSLVLPVASGGDGELTYSLSPNVPGLTFDAATRTLSGTPTEAGDYALIYRVEDRDGDADELTFTVTVTVTVTVDEKPEFADTVADRTFAVGEAMSSLPLPVASGGDGELTYSLSPNVPGLTFNAATRTLSGEPTVAGVYALTYRVEDSDGDAAELRFTVTVEEPIVDLKPTFSGTVANQTVTGGEVMLPLVLPAGSGGDGELTYSLSPEVPGLSFDAATRTLSGEPTVAGDYALIYRVEDSDGDADELTFTVTVTEPEIVDREPMFTDTVADQRVVAGEVLPSLVLPVASGGDGELTYSLSPEVPGLTFDAATRTLSGEPTVAGVYALTYRVEDSDGDAAELRFTVTVEEPIVDLKPTFSGTVANQTVTGGEVMLPLVLPVASGGDGELTYSLSPEVPGLTFDAATRTLSGEPTVAGVYALTYRVEDSDGDAAELRFTVTVTEPEIVDREPMFTDTVADQRVVAGEVLPSLVLPVASGGDGELTYSLSPEVPGLSFDAATRTLSGEPTVAGVYALTYRVEDSDGDAAELRFTVTVEEPIVDLKPTFSGTVANQTVTGGEVMLPLVLPAGSGGDGELTYSLSPEVPGLSFDAATRTLSGEPTVAGVYALTYRVEDSDGDAAELRFTVTVTEPEIVDREPMFTDTVADQRVVAGEVLPSLVLPVASGGDGELTYSLSPEVPGLSFDAATRTLSGEPTVAGVYALTYRVEDSDGDAAELTFTVTVTEPEIVDREPMFTDTVADQRVVAGEVLPSLVLPVASGGDGELTYSLSPEVPGLSFNAATRTLSGTPTEAGDYALIYRVEDRDDDTDELTFTIVVAGMPSFEGTAELPGGMSMEFVWIEPGVFQMGSNTGRSDESPRHEVEISRGFWLGKYEVTQGQWKAVMDTEPWSGRDRVEANSSHPAVIISWNEVQEFIGRLNAAAGEELYRLPTEAEWEYACRAGTNTLWSFGDDGSLLTNYAWYHDNNYPTKGAKAVGGKLPNPWGLYDMHGNVWEWVQDWYDEDYYNSSLRVDPQGPTSGLGRVIRGGHFGHIDGVRSAYRHFHYQDSRSYTIGVRLLKISGD